MRQPLGKIALLLILALLLGNGKLYAIHIVGADITYTCLNPVTHSYRVTLTLYRDCDPNSNGAPFDDPIELFIFRSGSGSLYQTKVVNMNAGTPPVISPTTWGNCALGTPSICVHVGTYQTTVTLPPLVDGYDIGWARCCRTNNISNLVNPGDIGVTFSTHVPDPGVISNNSSPVFNNLPPTFLCRNQQLVFNHGATDVDGDSLVYQMTNPFTGLNTAGLGAGNNVQFGSQPWLGPAVIVQQTINPYGFSQNNPMGPPPYANAQFNPGYSFTNPFGANNLVLDPNTGFLTVTPTLNGTFVLAISVFEYRNGVLLGETKRDIQINVINCLPPPPPPTITANLGGLTNSNDTVFVQANVPFCFNHTITSSSSTAKLNAQGISTTFGSGATITFTGVGTNSMTATFCWTPSCAYNNQVARLIISARDTNYCQNVASVFDTIWIKVSSPAPPAPSITANLSGLNTLGDTIYINPNEQLCFPVTIALAGNSATPLPYTVVSPAMGSGATFTTTGTNPIVGTFCWTPSCANSNQLIPVLFSLASAGQCQTLTAQKQLFIKVVAIPNPPPTITATYNGANVLNDTLDIIAGEARCFDFSLSDPDTGFPLTYTTKVLPATGVTFSTAGTNPMTASLCWQSDCSYEGQVIQIQIEGADTSQCSGSAKVLANIWIRVNTPPNNIPTFTADYTGLTKIGDTLFVYATEEACYTFTATDLDGDSLQATLTSTGTNPTLGQPSLAVVGTNPLVGQVCWIPDCAYEGQTIPLVMEIRDEAKCSNQSVVIKRLWIKVIAPPNTAPGIQFDLSGFTTDGDTVFALALDSLCIPFTASDPEATQTLQPTLISPTGSNGTATLTVSGTNPLAGTICWTPQCDQVGQTIPITLKVRDNALCNKELELTKTIWVKVDYPLNEPPVIATSVISNYIQIVANDTPCFTFTLTDPNLAQAIVPTVSMPVPAANQPTMTFTGTNPVTGTICWGSSCAFEGQTIPITIQATDDPECDNKLTTTQIVFVEIVRPILATPTVTMDLSGTPHFNNTIFAEQAQTYCISFEVIDNTPTEGKTFFQYQFLDRNGQNLGYGEVDTTVSGDTLKGNICVNLGCNTGGGTYTIAITGYDYRECPPYDSSRAEVYIKVNPNDFSSFAGSDQTFCADENGVQLSAYPINGIPTYSVEWFCNDQPFCGIQHKHDTTTWVQPAQDSVEYYVQFTDSAGCTSKIDTVLVLRRPAPQVQMPADTFICAGAPGVFLPITILNNGSADAPGPYSVQWVPGTGLNDSTAAMPYATPTQTTIYQPIVTSLKTGCSNKAFILSQEQTVTVEVREVPVIHAGTDLYVCKGDTVQLRGYATGGGLPYLYSWTPVSTGYMSDPASPEPLVSPLQTTTYALSVVSRGCTGVADSATVFVNTLPSGDAGADLAICYGETVQLLGTSSLPDSGFTYQWTPATGLNDSQLLRPLATPPATTTYKLQVFGPGGCASPLYPVTLKVNPTPLVSLRPDTSLCSGDSVKLLSSFVSSEGNFPQPVQIRWTPTESLSTATALNPWARPTATTTYRLIASHLACADTAYVTLTVTPSPQPAIALSDSVLCAGDSLTLTISGGLGNPSLTWLSLHAQNLPESTESAAQFVAWPQQSTTYTLLMQEGACTGVASQSVTVFPTPTADIWGIFSACDTLHGLYQSNSPQAVAHAWDFGDGSPISNLAQVEHTYLPGNYQLRYTALGVGGCRQDSLYPVTVAPLPEAVASLLSPDTLVLPGATVSVSTTNAGSLWQFGDGATATTLLAEHQYSSAGEKRIVLTVRDSSGCQDTLTFRVVVVEPSLEIPNVITPNGDGKNDLWQIRYNGNEKVSAEVFDRWGRQMYATEGNPAWNGLATDASPVATGVYYYQLHIGGKSYRGDLTVVR